jgi:hypothetical protein
MESSANSRWLRALRPVAPSIWRAHFAGLRPGRGAGEDEGHPVACAGHVVQRVAILGEEQHAGSEAGVRIDDPRITARWSFSSISWPTTCSGGKSGNSCDCRPHR